MGPVSLVVVLALSDGTAAGRAQLLDTLGLSLDSNRISMRPRVLGEASREVLSELSEQHPVVEVQWVSPATAVVRAALRPREWTTRTLIFEPGDPLLERAKAIAFTVAAMMPQWRSLAQLQTAPPTPVVLALSAADFDAPSADAGSLISSSAMAGEVGVIAAPAAGVSTGVASADSAETPVRGLVSVSAVGTLPLGGGAVVDAALCPVSALCFGLEGALLAGAVDAAQASARVIELFAMVDLRAALWWSGRVGGLLRAGVGALNLSLTRGSELLARWVAAGSLEAGPLLRLGRFDLTISLGIRGTGATRVFVGGGQVSEIANFSGFGRLGLAVRW